MITILFALVSLLSIRLRSRALLELELVALRHHVKTIRPQRPGQLRLFSSDRLLWAGITVHGRRFSVPWVLVKPATVIHWHRKGFLRLES